LENFSIQSAHKQEISGLETVYLLRDDTISTSIGDGQERSIAGVIIRSQ